MSGVTEDFQDPITSAFTPASKMRAAAAAERKQTDMMTMMENLQRQLQDLEEKQIYLQLENDTLREIATKPYHTFVGGICSAMRSFAASCKGRWLIIIAECRELQCTVPF